MKLQQVNFNAEFISRMIPRLEWRAVLEAAESVSIVYIILNKICDIALLQYHQLTILPSCCYCVSQAKVCTVALYNVSQKKTNDIFRS